MRSWLFNTLLLINIAVTAHAAGIPQPPRLPESFRTLDAIRQAKPFSCGCAAFLSVARHRGCNVGFESNLYTLLGSTPEQGTTPWNLAAGFRKLGLLADVKENLTVKDLHWLLAHDFDVIVDLQAWRDESHNEKQWAQENESGHYVALVAMDDYYAYFMDPALRKDADYGYMPLHELGDRWHDYEIVDGKEIHTNYLGVIVKGRRSSKKGSPRLVYMR